MTTLKSFGPLTTPPHQVGDIPDIGDRVYAWRDNAALMWWDPENEIYGQFHFSTTPNGQGSRVRCSLQIRDRGIEFEEPLPAGQFNSASVTIDLARGITVRHPRLSMDFQISPLFGVLDWSTIEAMPGAGPGLKLNHYQHGFRATGSFSIEGLEKKFSGVGWRDRTWGYREESKQWNEHFYFCAIFEERFAIVLWKSLGADGMLREFGWLITEENQERIDSASLIRDGTSNFAGATVELRSETLTLEVIEKPTPFRGWWLPMGPSRQVGPTFGEFDEHVLVRLADGICGAGLAAHGAVRRLV